MDKGQAQGLAVSWIKNLPPLPVHKYLSLVCPVHTGNDFDQGGFAGTVLTDKGMHFAPADIKIHMVQCALSGKILYDSPRFQ